MSERDLGGRSSATPRRLIDPASSSQDLPRRTTPAHFPSVEIGSRSILTFLTICTKRRRPLLATDQVASLLIEAWTSSSFWRVGRYVILPDHIHLFCAPNTFPPEPLKNWISFWKNYVTRAWPNRNQVPIWQSGYWDRQLRREESYAEKWTYVENNPVRHGYVARPDEWPHRGELNVLQWHD